MATYFTLLSDRNKPVEAIFAATDKAEENRVRECDASTRIQSVARMRRARSRYVRVRSCIIAMQRVYRGYVGRRRFLDIVHAKQLERQRAVFDHFATVVQRHFRGFYSRKWRSDFFCQKRYLQQVEARSQAVREDARQAYEHQVAEVADREDAERRAKFEATAGQLHHLLSTAVRSGVLRPAMAATGLTTVFGTNVEDDLRAVPIQRRKYRADVIPPDTSSVRTMPTRGGSPVRRVEISQQPYQRSLQSSTAYDAEVDRQRLDNAVSATQMRSLHDKPFVTRKPGPQPPVKTINAESDYFASQKARAKVRR